MSAAATWEAVGRRSQMSRLALPGCKVSFDVMVGSLLRLQLAGIDLQLPCQAPIGRMSVLSMQDM